MLATVVVLLLVAAFVLVAAVAGLVVRKLWTATAEHATPSPQED